MTPKETVQNLYAAFATGDVPTVLAILAPDMQWTEAAGFPYAGTYVGPQAVLSGVPTSLQHPAGSGGTQRGPEKLL